MGQFKRPLVVTAIAVALALVLSIAASTWIYMGDGSARQKRERARLLGGGLGVTTALAVAPFWLIAAAKVGKERARLAMPETSENAAVEAGKF